MLLELKMPFSQSLLIAFLGISIVMVVLCFIALMIILISKVVRAIEKRPAEKKDSAPESSQNPKTGLIPVEGVSQGTVELIGTSEREAAVIMAIVSNKSGIPLNRLSFSSIKALEEQKK